MPLKEPTHQQDWRHGKSGDMGLDRAVAGVRERAGGGFDGVLEGVGEFWGVISR